jgi:predicted DNA-binding transcriptional regulator AlpA
MTDREIRGRQRCTDAATLSIVEVNSMRGEVTKKGKPGRKPGQPRLPTTPLKLIRPKTLARLLSVHETTIVRWKKNGVLPAPIEVGPGVRGWTQAQLADLFARCGVELKDDG